MSSGYTVRRVRDCDQVVRQTIFYEPERRIRQSIRRNAVDRIWGQVGGAVKRQVSEIIFSLNGEIERTICIQAREDNDDPR